MATSQQAPKAPSGIREPRRRSDRGDPLRQLLAGIPVTERRLELAGVPTAVLEGGDGPAIVLLHGPGESSVNWRWVLPQLVETPSHDRPGPARPQLEDCGVDPNVEQPDAFLDALRAELESGSPVHRRKRS